VGAADLRAAAQAGGIESRVKRLVLQSVEPKPKSVLKNLWRLL
jgi:hypothetical protein